MSPGGSPGARGEAYFRAEQPQEGIRGRALRGASYTVGGQAIAFVLQTAGTIVLARLLSPHDFGLVTMVTSVSLLLQSFGCNGFVEAVVQSKSVDHRQLSTLFWINVAVSLCLALLFAALAPALAAFYKEPALRYVVPGLAVSILLGGLSNQHVSLMTRNMDFFKTTANELLASAVSVALAIVLAWRGWGYWALVAKWVVSPAMIVLGAWAMCGWRPGLPGRPGGVRDLLRFAIQTYGNFAMSYFRRNLDKVLIGRLFGGQALGFYDRAYHLANLLPNMLIGPLNGVSLATFSRLAGDAATFRRTYLTVLSVLAFVGMPLSAALTLVARDVIRLLLGPQWETAGLIFAAFGPSVGIIILYMTHGWLHLSLGTPDRWFRWSLVEFSVTVALFMLGLRYGALGVAVAYSLSFYLLLGPALAYGGRPIGLKLSSVFPVVAKFYAAALVAALATYGLLYLQPAAARLFAGFGPLPRICVAGALCVSLYLGLVVVTQGVGPLVQLAHLARETVSGRRTAGAAREST